MKKDINFVVMKSKVLLYYAIVGLLTLGLFSCKKTEVKPVDLGYSYYPSNVGHWVLYDVDSTYYDQFHGTVTKSHFQIKEYFESTFLDNSNRPTQRLERYKQYDTVPFYLKDVWASNLTQSTAEKVEENVRFVKMIFPIAKGSTWNGNAFNTLNAQNYKYSNIFQPYTVNGNTFDSTVTVIQDIDTTNLLNAKNQVEIFANHVGLIYKRYKDVTLLPPYNDSIVGGVDYTMKIVAYGN